MKNRGDPEEILIRLFGSVSRARILALLICQPGQQLYQREIMYETGLALQPVQRELINLVEMGIVKKQEVQSRIYYQIDTASPFFKPLKEVCELASG